MWEVFLKDIAAFKKGSTSDTTKILWPLKSNKINTTPNADRKTW